MASANGRRSILEVLIRFGGDIKMENRVSMVSFTYVESNVHVYKLYCLLIDLNLIKSFRSFVTRWSFSYIYIPKGMKIMINSLI